MIYVIVLRHLQLNPLQERGAAPLSLQMNYPRCVCLTRVFICRNDISTDFQVNLFILVGSIYLDMMESDCLTSFNKC
jgi:hypothetical protein